MLMVVNLQPFLRYKSVNWRKFVFYPKCYLNLVLSALDQVFEVVIKKNLETGILNKKIEFSITFWDTQNYFFFSNTAIVQYYFYEVLFFYNIYNYKLFWNSYFFLYKKKLIVRMFNISHCNPFLILFQVHNTIFIHFEAIHPEHKYYFQ